MEENSRKIAYSDSDMLPTDDEVARRQQSQNLFREFLYKMRLMQSAYKWIKYKAHRHFPGFSTRFLLLSAIKRQMQASLQVSKGSIHAFLPSMGPSCERVKVPQLKETRLPTVLELWI